MTSSSNALDRPASTRTPSGSPVRNSSTTRLLPMPGSPSSVTRWARSRTRTRSNVSFSSASPGAGRPGDLASRWCAGGPERRPRSQRAFESLGLDRTQLAELDADADKLARSLAHEHFAEPRRLLQPGADVHLGPDHDVAVGGRADRHPPGVHADPDPHGTGSPSRA